MMCSFYDDETIQLIKFFSYEKKEGKLKQGPDFHPQHGRKKETRKKVEEEEREGRKKGEREEKFRGVKVLKVSLRHIVEHLW